HRRPAGVPPVLLSRVRRAGGERGRACRRPRSARHRARHTLISLTPSGAVDRLRRIARAGPGFHITERASDDRREGTYRRWRIDEEEQKNAGGGLSRDERRSPFRAAAF